MSRVPLPAPKGPHNSDHHTYMHTTCTLHTCTLHTCTLHVHYVHMYIYTTYMLTAYLHAVNEVWKAPSTINRKLLLLYEFHAMNITCCLFHLFVMSTFTQHIVCTCVCTYMQTICTVHTYVRIYCTLNSLPVSGTI